MRRWRPHVDWSAIPLTAIVLALVVVPAPSVSELPPPMTITVSGRPMLVPSGSTVCQAVEVLGMAPRRGDLVDVEGIPLKRGVYRGSVVVNGAPGSWDRRLAPGDVVDLVDARDHIEAVTVDIIPVPEGGIPNPQTHVGFVPGEQVITTGAISGKLVSSAFRPTGAGSPPPAVALTFDDGPSPRYTPRIVRILREKGVPATFFMVGALAERYPDVVRLVLEAGMQVGNHSMEHPTSRPFSDLPRHEIREQVERGHQVLTRLGAVPSTFRPPGGSWSDEVLDVAGAVGERLVLWSVDAEDFETPNPRVLATRVAAAAEPGSIVLLHDGGGRRQATVEALPLIIDALRARGLGFVPLG